VIYSVWNQAARLYDHYEDGAPDERANAAAPRHLGRADTLGFTPDEAAWPLPFGARKIGSGPTAVGRVARRRGAGAVPALSGFEVPMPLVALAAIWGLTYFVWRKR